MAELIKLNLNFFKEKMMQTKYLYTALTTLTLLITGCASHEHRINPTGASNVVSGKMLHGGTRSSDQLIVEMAGKRFEGNLYIKKYVDWENVRKAYGSDSEHWHKITSGLDKDHHTSVGRAEIRSADGEVMQCKLMWTRSDRPEGECIDQAGKSLELRFE
jgi:hypothetical protein